MHYSIIMLSSVLIRHNYTQVTNIILQGKHTPIDQDYSRHSKTELSISNVWAGEGQERGKLDACRESV